MQGPEGTVGVPLENQGDLEMTLDEMKQKMIENSAKQVQAYLNPSPVLVHLFTYHAPTPEQTESYQRIRAAALALANVIDRECPAGADRTAAVRKIREAVMTANASIATHNAPYR